ncbi:DUF2284 domain-containing protein [Desulfosporosinus sp. SB140]|uniref:DUF2284 domain-containing protein n=1 Tax=Desulfosporosinus paludis TaxID=3115649 RepID=UPI0038906DAE
MCAEFDHFVRDALDFGAKYAAIASVADIIFNEEFRGMCEQNTCGSYNKNWMCPPAVPPINTFKENVLNFKQGLLVQTVHNIKSSFDWEGMMMAAETHTAIFRLILDRLEKDSNCQEILPLNAGPCTYCKRCTFLDSEPCRFPDKALTSVEASGIDVMALEKVVEYPTTMAKILFPMLGSSYSEFNILLQGGDKRNLRTDNLDRFPIRLKEGCQRC